MKRMKKNTVVRNAVIGIGVAVALAGIAGVNLRATIADNQVTVAKKAGANDATKPDVLENYSFTSDAAGVGVAGSMTDYSSELKSIKLQAAANNGAITVDLDDGYYSQIMLDVDGVINNQYLMSYNASNYPLVFGYSITAPKNWNTAIINESKTCLLIISNNTTSATTSSDWITRTNGQIYKDGDTRYVRLDRHLDS